jgi:hypothetical protein
VAISLKGGMPKNATREERTLAGALRKISVEQDTNKLQALIAELSRTLEERQASQGQ